MKIDVLGVQAFVAVAEQGGFRKAAGTLFITQTALSRRLKNLETFLGVQLVERTTRSSALTSIGEHFLPQAARMLAELQSSLQEIRESGRAMRGDVTLACVPTVGIQYLPRVIARYAARYPDNRVRVLDHASAGVEQAVMRREAEFGITIAGQHHTDLVSRPLVIDRFVLVCRSDHPLARRRRIRWHDLGEHRLILPGGGSSNRPLLDARMADLGINLVAQFEVQRSSTAIGLAAAGVGAALVPSLAVEAGLRPELRVLELTEPTLTRGFALLLRRNASLSPAAEAMVELVEQDAAGQRRRIRAPSSSRAAPRPR
ncbi:LysR family transcriptional regulator [soil metagenome]